MRRFFAPALLVLLALLAVPAAAQEVQVPLDETGRVQTVDRRLAQRLGLWVDRYPGFQEARLFRSADGAFVLEISTVREGRLQRERVPVDAAEVARLRAQVGELLAERAELDERGELSQEGRYLLLGQTTLAGLAFYGWAVPYVLDVEENAAGGLYLLTAAGSFFAPFALSQGRPVTYGMANLSRYGVTRGIPHGLLLYNLIVGDEEEVGSCVPDRPCDDVDEGFDDDRGRIATALVASAAEGVAGYLWARNERMSPGTANAIALGGDVGLLGGLGTAFLFGTEDIGERSTAAITLPLTAAGIVGGHWLARRRDHTWGDVDVLYTGGAVGALAGLALADLSGIGEEEPESFDPRFEDDDTEEKALVAGAMLGGAAALYLADRLVGDTDFSVGQATLNRLGALAGGLAGAGVGILVNEENETASLVGAALGAIGGYALTYSALAGDAPAGRGERMPSMWEIRLQPQALLAAPLSAGKETIPLLSVGYRFGGGR